MAIQDDASLAMIPAAYGAAKLYSVIPSNGNGDFTHSRTGNAQRVNKGGFNETMGSNVPRLDYPLIDGVVQSCPALLLEPSRTNKITASEDANGGGADRQQMSYNANVAISPDGSQTADEMIPNTASSSHFCLQYRDNDTNTSFDTTKQYTFSAFFKSNGKRYVQFVTIIATGGTDYVNFDIEDGVITSTGFDSSSINDYGNGWYRVSVTFTPVRNSSAGGNDGFNGGVAIPSPTSTRNPSWVGNDSDGFYIWGIQFEEECSYPTSYIPTSGSTVTRSADQCNGAGTSAEFNDSEGVLFAEVAALDEAQGTSVITISDSSLSDRVLIAFVSGELRGEFVSTGGTHTRTSSGLVIENFNKIACSYTATTFKVFINGSQVLTTGTITTSMSGIVELAFDRGDGANDFYGNTKQLMTFNQALTDSELEQITSWTSFSEMAKGQLYTIE